MSKSEPVRSGYRTFVMISVVIALAMLLSAGSVMGQEESAESSGGKAGQSFGFYAPGGLKVRDLMGSNPVRILSGTPEERAWIRITVRDMPVRFLADTIAQETTTDIITATGSVTIESGTSTVESHTLVYNAKTRKGRLSGKPGSPGGVRLMQSGNGDDQNYYETDWMIVTFGDGGIEEIETGPGVGEIWLPGEGPLPIGVVEPATGEEPKRDSEGLPRSIAPPPIDE
jgi:hypothetical protein